MASGVQITLSVKDDGTAAIQKVAGEFGQMEKQGSTAAAKLSDAWGKVKTAAFALGAAAAATGAGLFALTRSFAATADQLGKMSEKLGISVEQLSRLKFGAELANVPLEALQTGLRTLAQNMAQAMDGTGEQAKAFAALGIKVTESNGALRSVNDVLHDVADKFAGMTDKTQRAALAQQLFGRAGLELIPMLKDGAAGLKAMGAEADALGVTISGETARQAEAFNDNLTRLTAAAEGLKNILGGELLKVFAPLVEGMLKWVAANRALITTNVTEYAETLANAVARIALALPAVRLVAGAFQGLAAALGVVLTGLSAVGLGLAKIAQGALDLFLAFTPIGQLLGIVFPEGMATAQAAMASLVESMTVLTSALAKSTQELAVAAGDNLAKGFEALKQAVDPNIDALTTLKQQLDVTGEAQERLKQKTDAATGALLQQGQAAKQAGQDVAAAGNVIGGGTGTVSGVAGDLRGFIPQGDLPIASGKDPFFFGTESPQDALAAIDRELAVLNNRLRMDNWVGTLGAHRFQMEGAKALSELYARRDQVLNRLSAQMGNQTTMLNFNFNGTVIGGDGAARQFVREHVAPELRQLGYWG